uniref:Uncharacterized protein n=1 Tax=Arundo donax TaxID=35708 RepID=A0A0A9RR05_ARUDO
MKVQMNSIRFLAQYIDTTVLKRMCCKYLDTPLLLLGLLFC